MGDADTLTTLGDWFGASPDDRASAVAAAVARIAEADESVRAWVQVEPQPPVGNGPLVGIPFGAKDIIETRGLATEYGSPIYAGRVGTEDAAIIRRLRGLGAVLMGKTQTTAFAWRTPSVTRNPRHLQHTPGGSSSGSAAAVAAGMVPFALGTQTLGSVLRPASYCGVTGFKPSYGVLAMDGVLPCASSLDTLGLFTHRAQDMLPLWAALGQSVGADGPTPIGVPERVPGIEPAMAAAVDRAVDTLRAAGVPIVAIDINDQLTRIGLAARIVLAYEASRVHEERFREHGDRLQDLAGLVREGLATPTARYDDARRLIDAEKMRMWSQFAVTPVILVPAATGPAPRGLASTGDPAMNAPWTALGSPAISIPLPVGDGLPLGLQLTAGHGQDAMLLQAAVRIEGLLGSAPR